MWFVGHAIDFCIACPDDVLLVKCSLWSFLNDCFYMIKLCYMFSYLVFFFFFFFFLSHFTCSLYMPCVLLVSYLIKFICYVQVFQDTGVYGSSTSQLLDLGVSEFCLYPQTHV